MADLCHPCKSRGRLAPGKHLVYENGVVIRKCDDCKSLRIHPQAVEVNVSNKENVMPKKVDADWYAIQSARDSGETVASISKRTGIGSATIYNRTKTPSARKHQAGKGSLARKVVRQGGSISAAIAELVAKRERIDQAITTLRGLES